MKLLYFVQYFPPETASGLPLVTDMIEAFADRGMDVLVYTPTPTRGVTEETRKYYKREKKVIVSKGGKLVIHHMALYREGKGFAQRTIRYTIFSLECFLKGLTIPADAVFLSSGPPTQALVVGLLKKFTKKRIVYNLQDIFPDSMINAGIIKEGSKAEKIGRWMENVSYRNADAIITVSDDMLRNIQNKGVDEQKTYMVRNWIDTEVIKPVSREENHLFDELGLDRRNFYIVYSGNIGYTMGLDQLILAAEKVRDISQIKFVIFGDGSEKEKLQSLVSEKKIGNVHFFPFQPAERIPEVYGIGDMVVISGKKGLSGISMPSKTWTILGAGRGILAVFDLDSELAKLVNSSECGKVVDPDKLGDLVSTIRSLYENRDQCQKYGENARKYAETYVSKEKALQEYADIIEKKQR